MYLVVSSLYFGDMEDKKKIKYFTDLDTWKEGHNLVLIIYKTTEGFPEKEKFSLIDQMRRAAVSITSKYC